MPQQNAFRADDDGPFGRAQDERGPGIGDTDVVRAVALLTRGGRGLGGQFGVGLVEGGPAQLVENARTQSGGEQRYDVVAPEESHGFRGDVRDHGAERRELVESALQPGESSCGRVLLGAFGQPLPQDHGEHRVLRQLRHAGVAQPLTVSGAEAADVPAQEGAEERPFGDGGEVPRAGYDVDEPGADRKAGGVRGARVLLGRLGDGDAGGQAEVEKVQIGVALPAALEQFDGVPVGAQPVRHPGGRSRVCGLRPAVAR